MSKIRSYSVASLVVLLAACAGATANDEGAQPAPSDQPTVTVHNNHNAAVDVWEVLGGMRVLVGTVPALKTRELRIPRQLLGRPELQFQAEVVGAAGAFTFPAFLFQPDMRIQLFVQPSLSMSSLQVW